MTRTCLAVWDADPSCRGWQPGGNPLHGCEHEPGHTRYGKPHRCRCGDRPDPADLLPAPQGPNLSSRDR